MAIYVAESHEQVENYGEDNERRFLLGESDTYEAYTDDRGKLFRHFQKEYGRCAGFVYVMENGKEKKVGWIFEKRRKYSDADEYYFHRIWVTLKEKPDTVTVEEHLLTL